MANWTVDQVSNWLQTNGFEKYIQNFKDNDIDGAAIRGLEDDDILKLLSILNQDGTIKNPTKRTQREFKRILEEYQEVVKEEKKKKRRNNSKTRREPDRILNNNENNLLSVLLKKTVPIPNDSETYSTIYIVDSKNISSKFFKNQSICSVLTKYILNKYNVQCHTPTANQYETKDALEIKLSGVKDNVKNARNELQSLFETIKTKIFNHEEIDKKVMRWSKHIYSDSALVVLQKIFSNKKKLTVWEKTNILSGYYIVHYVSGKHKLGVSEEFINRTINNEISFVRDIIIPHVNNIQPNFRKEIEEFLNNKKQQQRQFQTMAIIHYLYYSQMEMKINLFGLRNQVEVARRQIKQLINKHHLRTTKIGLNLTQREYLLDNYVHELKKIELDYKDDNVKIQIRENSIIAPQYLTMKIKQLIQSMISNTSTLNFRYIENAITLTEQNDLQLKVLAQTYNCELDRIDINTREEPILLPKGKNISASTNIVNESEDFYSSLFVFSQLFIATNTIEIHKSDNETFDINIISTNEDAVIEKIDSQYGNGYFESDTGKRVLLMHGSPFCSNENNHHMKKSINKFISEIFNQIDTLDPDTIKTIAFSTTNWEKYNNNVKQLVEEFLNEMKYQLETEKFSNRSWKIFFVFDDEQKDLFDVFSQIILALQMKMDDYEQFFYPISTTSIILKTSGNSNVLKCENAIRDYMKKNVLTTVKLHCPFDSELWNQYMINIYYKYCLKKYVLPHFYRIDEQENQQQQQQQHLDLIGPISAAQIVKQKYEMMSEIERQKRLVHTQPHESIEKVHSSRTKGSKKGAVSYNIILNCCSNDQELIEHFSNRLIDEGYQVLIDYNDIIHSNITSEINKTDLIVICFSFNYSENHNCIKNMVSIKKSTKKFVPLFLITNALNEQNNWLQITNTQELFYEKFEEEIKFKLDENFDLNYDKLLIELLRYTKPGALGQTYPISNNIVNKEEKPEENTSQKNRISDFTPEQILKKECIYKEYIEQLLEKNKIPENELIDINKSLTRVLNYYNSKDHSASEEGEHETEESIQDINQDDEEQEQNQDESEQEEINSVNIYDNNISHEYLRAFLSSLQCWMDKALNGPVIKGNLPPFTVTGDFNDAIFPTSITNKAPWWEATANLYKFDHSSSPFDVISPDLIIGSWCNYDEAHHFFQKFIDKDIKFRDERLKQRFEENEHKDEVNQSSNEQESEQSTINSHSYFKTTIKKGTVAWDITENRQVLKEYERRQNGEKRRKLDGNTTGWKCLMDRSVQLISDLKEGKINIQSNEIQGRIGNELKTREAIRRRNELDDPNYRNWKDKGFKSTRKFIRLKIRNTIKWQKFCAEYENNKSLITK
ncbi:unnamed protein product [Adineta steineri]|uniref:SAM domain-containing protein n=1 Tax=Adineta steineri TaxID=433720 RepID=A0A814Q3U3_9BILA|nr:unnamed protein product [Adineta steineri]CAF3770196.1 unnamed protein product [Adineta steineri]